MSRPTKIVVDCSTGVEEIIELTDQEIADLEAAAVEAEARRAEEEAAKAAAEAAKESARAKLAALGLTQDEIAALSK